MTIYKIYTQRLKVPQIKKIVKRYFEGATLQNTLGITRQWGEEKSLLIEIITDQLFNTREEALRLSKDIAIMNCQSEVWCLEFKSDGSFHKDVVSPQSSIKSILKS